MKHNPEFDAIVKADFKRDEELLAIMADPRIGRAVIMEVLPQLPLQASNDLEEVFNAVAADYGVEVSDVKEAYERAVIKFSREVD